VANALQDIVVFHHLAPLRRRWGKLMVLARPVAADRSGARHVR
jgi:hypothetical protein